MGSQCLSMKSGNSVLSLFLLVLLVSLLLPEADCWGVRGRALANRRTARKGRVRSSQGQRQRPPQRKPKRINRRRGSKSWEEAPPESDVAYNDGSAPSDPLQDAPTLDAAGASGDLAGVCEVLMFNRGEGTYSLKFVQNKC